MALKKGYKQTEVGVIPDDWLVKRIKSVCKLVNGRGFKPFEWKSTGLPIIRIQNLNGSDEFNYFEGSYDKKLEIAPGQLLFAWSGSRGTSFGPHIWDGPLGLLNYHTWKVDVKEDQVNKEFFLYALRQLTSFIEGNAHGASALVHTQKWEMEGFEFPLPPTLAEQEAIARALSDADAWIESLEQLIAKKRQVKQGAMQELLTGKRRLPGFSGQWRESFLKEIVECSPSGTYGLDRQSLGLVAIPVATTAQISNDDKWNGKPMNSRYFTLEQAETYAVKQGDLIVVKSSGSAASIQSGKMVLVDSELSGSFLFSNFLMRLRPRTVGSHFLYYYLTSSRIKKMLPSLCEASTYPNIRINEYLEIRIPLPSIAEQTAIATVLSDMDAEIGSLESKLAKAREIKHGMMQELLTGRIRLV